MQLRARRSSWATGRQGTGFNSGADLPEGRRSRVGVSVDARKLWPDTAPLGVKIATAVVDLAIGAA
jgi:hypothetical protein